MSEGLYERITEIAPEFARAARQFMALYDAAEVLDDLNPPYGDVAAEFCREVAKTVMNRTGMGEAFTEAMIRSRPSYKE